MYPLLRSLEAEGLVAGEWEHPERRSRRFYRAHRRRARTSASGCATQVGAAARPPGRLDRGASARSSTAGGARTGTDRGAPAGSATPRRCGTTRRAGRRSSTASARGARRRRTGRARASCSGTRGPDGRGRVLERVLRYAAGDGQDAEVEDEQAHRPRSEVRFAPGRRGPRRGHAGARLRAQEPLPGQRGRRRALHPPRACATRCSARSSLRHRAARPTATCERASATWTAAAGHRRGRCRLPHRARRGRRARRSTTTSVPRLPRPPAAVPRPRAARPARARRDALRRASRTCSAASRSPPSA